MNEFRQDIPTLQDGTQWDCDSSPKAWEYYKKFYTKNHWEFISTFDWDNPKIQGDTYKRILMEKKASYAGKNGALRIGGETDFNFNDKKYPVFKNILEQVNADDVLFEKLDFCKQHHHAPVNFSLMLSTGNMQGFKGAYNPYDIGSYDRPDSFIYALDKYYSHDDEAILANARPLINRQFLQGYLDEFNDIYDYCQKVYFITDKALVDELIKNGQRPLSTTAELDTYMLLAIKFWTVKEQYFASA